MSYLRKGMWVECPLGVGILASMASVRSAGADPETEQVFLAIDLVNEDGSTRMAGVPVLLAEISQARAAAIPKNRIDHLSNGQLAALGYT